MESYNRCVNSILVMLLITVRAGQIVSASLLMQQAKSDLKIPLPFNIVFVCSFIQCSFVILGVFSFPGEFYQNSKESHDILKRKSLIKFRAAQVRRHTIQFLRSCNVLKIKFGLSNFIEKTTPPVFQLFCTDRIIDILLTQI